MFRTSVAIIAMNALLFPSHLIAGPCASPFAGIAGQFRLVETLSCNSVTSPVKLDIESQNSTNKIGYLTAECDKTSPYFDMYNGQNIVSYSDTLASATSSLVRVSDTCSGIPLYLVDRHPTLYTLPSGTKVNTSIRVFAQDNAQTLIGYVAATDDTTDGLVLRDANTNILASATKKFNGSPTSSECSAVWTVTNPSQSEQTAAVVSFLLNLKDNPAVSCQTPAVCNTQGVSAGGLIAIGAAIGVGTTIMVGVAALCYIKHRAPHYYKGIQ